MSENNEMSASEQKKEDWMNSKWRPMMGWMYMAVCACDFMLFPVLWSIHQALNHGQISSQWQPLTLQGAGLFHIAMGAVLGIAAYGRTKEKMAGAENGGLHSGPDLSQGFGTGAGTTYVPPGQGQVNVSNQPMGGGFNNGGFNNSSMGGPSTFGSPTTSFGGSAPSFGSAPAPAFGAPAPSCPNTGRPLGPAQSFPAL